MSRESIELGSTPPDEDCASVGRPDYYDRVKIECHAYRNQIVRWLEERGHKKESWPESFRVVTKGMAGGEAGDTYYGVHVRFDTEIEAAVDLAYLVEAEGPLVWDEEARRDMEQARAEQTSQQSHLEG